ncbi:MAG TPA: leucyl aminopeptidase [Rhodospirillales bacterium]|nr:leucyl aminopeptidase [Rhodospirillales bacterium]
MKLTFAAPGLPETGVVAAFVLEDRELSASARALNDRLRGALVRAIEAGKFKGKKDQVLALPAPVEGSYDRVVLVGVGKAADLDALRLQALGGQIYAGLAGEGVKAVAVAVDALEGAELTPPEMAAEMAFGARLRAYRFDKYLTKEKDEDKPQLELLTFHCDNQARAKRLFAPKEAVAAGVHFSRDLVSEPANVIYPASLAAEAEELRDLGVEVEVLGEREMKKLGMGALLGVGQGSERESQLVVMQWWGLGRPPEAEEKGRKGKRAKAAKVEAPAPLAFIGKGVTFDTGGISIKPSAGMEDMKWDMAGSAAVVGLMKALAGRKARVNVVGVVGLVENMPSGTAQRPGDIVTSMSGQTIEVLNTDAEGRLVLADAMWYTKDRFKPRLMVDLATLTGAIIIALGHEMAGLFSNDDDLAAKLAAAGKAVGEPLWRMPLGEEYDKLIKSDAADMKNIGNRGAGSITAAQFLQRFVDGTPWAHLDIAGVAWAKKDTGTVPKGGTGFGVRLLDRFIAENYESE